MKVQLIASAALPAFGLLASASVLRLEVSHDGDLDLEVNTNTLSKSLHAPELESSNVDQSNSAHSLGDDDYVVDIWPSKHKGFLVGDSTPNYIRFSNIQYGEPPVEDLRFFKAAFPRTYSESINEGKEYRICPQHQVGWFDFAKQFSGDFALSTGNINKKWNYPITPGDNYTYPIPSPSAGSTVNVTEDCLYLDVMVPKKIWDDRKKPRAFKPAVVVWIHGGGFIFGHKNQHGSPIGLFEAAQNETEDNIIYVTMNYRLGAFGFLGGDKFLNEGGTGNAGLTDQKLALDWVKDNIYLFGGDSGRVAVVGQSAGASSIMHHLTAGKGDSYYRPPVRQAILLSPGFFPQPNNTLEDITYTKFLNLTGAKDLDALLNEKGDSPALLKANAEMSYNSSYGIFQFGPTIDGDYVRDLPAKSLKSGSFHKGIPLLLGYTRNDGVAFTPPWLRSNSDLNDYVKKLFPGAPADVLKYVEEHYPIKSSESERDKLRHVADFLDDIAIQCNVHYLANATVNSESNLYHPVYRYAFNSFPASHGTDADYLYHPEKPLLGVPPNATLANFIKKAIVDFARYTDPNPEGVETWKPYTNDNKKIMNLGDPEKPTNYDPSYGPDLLDAARCDYWQDAPYYVKPKSATEDTQFVVQTDL